MTKDKINWDKVRELVHSHFLQIQKKTEEFLIQNPDWAGCCDFIDNPPRICLCFWLRPEKRRKRGLKTFVMGNCGKIKSGASFISEEEIEIIVVFVNNLIEDGKNLRAKRVLPYRKCLMEYKIQIGGDYSLL